jgi:hypothetical protein
MGETEGNIHLVWWGNVNQVCGKTRQIQWKMKVEQRWLEDRWRRPPNAARTRRGTDFGGSRDRQFVVIVATKDRFVFCALHASALCCSILWACVAYHFTAEPLLLLDVSTSQHLQLTGASLKGEKFDELTCCKGGILWRWQIEIMLALQ